MNGCQLIAQERLRQINTLGWTAEHDDAHTDQQLGRAGLCYAVAGTKPGASLDTFEEMVVEENWPEDWQGWWKPSPNRIRNLVKAGALIAAQIDYWQRWEQKQQSEAQA